MSYVTCMNCKQTYLSEQVRDMKCPKCKRPLFGDK